jgi:hypothetical protein
MFTTRVSVFKINLRLYITRYFYFYASAATPVRPEDGPEGSKYVAVE